MSLLSRTLDWLRDTPMDASGIIHIGGKRFLLAEDETDVLRIFELDTSKRTLTATDQVLAFGEGESDFESLAYMPENDTYFCIGSHGEDASERLVSFRLHDGSAQELQELTFDARELVGKKVNVEALSSWRSKLLIGYRSPRDDNHALMKVFDTANGTQIVTRFDLSGRTFRDMVRVDSGNYLILAGPERGKDYDKLAPRIFWWNGELFARRLVECNIDLHGYRAEGIATLLHSDGSLDILIGSDESKTGDKFKMLYLGAKDLDQLLHDKLEPAELRIE